MVGVRVDQKAPPVIDKFKVFPCSAAEPTRVQHRQRHSRPLTRSARYAGVVIKMFFCVMLLFLVLGVIGIVLRRHRGR